MGYIGNQSAGITYTNINTFRGKVSDLTALSAVSGMENGDLYITEDNNHAHMYTGTVWVDLGEIRGPVGPVGPRGISGASVSTVVRTTGDGSAGTTDVYTITYDDATTSTFSVYNGIDGKDGMPGIIDHVTQTAGDGTQGTTDTYTMYADAGETQILGTFDVYNGYDGVASTVGSLVDVDLTTVPVEDGQTIVWNEVEGKWLPGDVSSSAISTTYDNTTSGLTATDLQGAIDEIENFSVKLSGDQTIDGVKTFTSNIVGNVTGNITGNSGTATKLATSITINGVEFDGSADIIVVDSTKAPLDSPELTGVPTAPTAEAGTNTTQIATTAFVNSAIDASGGSVGGSATYTTSGTWTCPDGVYTAFVRVLGGGAGGGGGGSSGVGVGGGGGSAVENTALVKVTPGTEYTITIGAGGAGGAGSASSNPGVAGGAGGSSSALGITGTGGTGGTGGTSSGAGVGGFGSETPYSVFANGGGTSGGCAIWMNTLSARAGTGVAGTLPGQGGGGGGAMNAGKAGFRGQVYICW